MASSHIKHELDNFKNATKYTAIPVNNQFEHVIIERLTFLSEIDDDPIVTFSSKTFAFTGSQGNSGSQGIEGNIGEIGPKGPQGFIGDLGSQGQPGLNGSQGLQGSIGEIGQTGQNGILGMLGPQGSVGMTGSQGFIGFIGPQGEQGLIGNTGLQGPQGNKGLDSIIFGPQGLMGWIGNTGYFGQIGTFGISGVIGSQGPQGPQGEIGLQGIKGTTGSQGLIGITGSIGNQGIQGIIGISGAKGPDATTGSTGAIGPIGFQGEIGMTGPIGPDSFIHGPIGPKGVSNNTSGSIGEIGPVGSIGEIGPTGQDSFIHGPTGNEGSMGNIGSQGPQGPQSTQLGPTGPQGITGPQSIQQGPYGPTGPKGQVVSNVNSSIYFGTLNIQQVGGLPTNTTILPEIPMTNYTVSPYSITFGSLSDWDYVNYPLYNAFSKVFTNYNLYPNFDVINIINGNNALFKIDGDLSYRGGTTTVYNNSLTVKGPWVQLNYDFDFVCTAVQLSPQINGWDNNIPGEFYLLGSNNNGSTFTLIQTVSSITWSSEAKQTFNILNSSSYNSLRLVFTKSWSIIPSWRHTIRLDEIEFLGYKSKQTFSSNFIVSKSVNPLPLSNNILFPTTIFLGSDPIIPQMINATGVDTVFIETRSYQTSIESTGPSDYLLNFGDSIVPGYVDNVNMFTILDTQSFNRYVIQTNKTSLVTSNQQGIISSDTFNHSYSAVIKLDY